MEGFILIQINVISLHVLCILQAIKTGGREGLERGYVHVTDLGLVFKCKIAFQMHGCKHRIEFEATC